MVTAEAYDRVGGFDESLIITYEESDFGWRVGRFAEWEYFNMDAAMASALSLSAEKPPA